MSYTINIRIENKLSYIEEAAIEALRNAAKSAALTRDQAADILRNFGPGIEWVFAAKGHVALCHSGCLMALVTSNHPDWN
jgi:hypothetical protein